MEITKESKLKKLKSILKKEIVSFFPNLMKIMKLMVINKTLFKLITEENWFKILKKPGFNKLLSISCVNSNEIKEIQNIFTDFGESEANVYQICLYIYLKKLKNETKLNLLFDSFIDYDYNKNRFIEDLISFTTIQEIDISNYNLGSNQNQMFIMMNRLAKNKSIKKIDLALNNLGLYETNIFHLKNLFQKNI